MCKSSVPPAVVAMIFYWVVKFPLQNEKKNIEYFVENLLQFWTLENTLANGVFSPRTFLGGKSCHCVNFAKKSHSSDCCLSLSQDSNKFYRKIKPERAESQNLLPFSLNM